MTDARNPADYRPNVGVCLFNRKGRVWLGRRFGQSGKHSWQFPQGGLDEGESPEFGALRELWEETGVTIAHLEPLGHIDEWLYYDFAPGTAKRKGLNFKGQRQLWFAYRFTGKASDVDLVSHGPQEFSEWKWAKLHKTPAKVVPFKRNVYERLAVEFAPFADGPD
jgi:putative (di)nucleoside polyphosphate hydrolase